MQLLQELPEKTSKSSRNPMLEAFLKNSLYLPTSLMTQHLIQGRFSFSRKSPSNDNSAKLPWPNCEFPEHYMTETLMLRMQDATEDHSAKEEAPQNLNIL